MTWVQDSPEFVSHLVGFAESRIRRADLLGEKYDVGGRIEDAERDIDVRMSTYQLARDALRLAEKLNSGSLEIQRLLAKTERYFQDYAPAYERLSRVIGWFNRGDQKDMLFYSHQSRGWLACFMGRAGSRRTQGRLGNPGSPRGSRQRL